MMDYRSGSGSLCPGDGVPGPGPVRQGARGGAQALHLPVRRG